MSARTAPDRNIAMELVRVTEAGAMAAARWIGRGEKESADQAAVDAMRFVLDSVSMRGVVVIGEGEKDEAPMLYNGEEVGNGEGPEVDVAVDPLEGTRLTALGQPNAIAVIAVAERGTMLFPGAAFYMEKIAVGPDAIDAIDIERSPTENVRAVAEALGKTPREVDVVVLERERHDELIAELREAGARVRLIRDGDVAPAIAAAQPGTGVDMLYGIGGTPEGVISAAALKCVGGGIQGRLWPRNDEERQRLLDGRPRPGAVSSTRRSRLGRGRLRRRDGRHDGLAAPGRPVHAGRRGHRLDRDALALGNGAPRRRAAVAREAVRADGLRVHLAARPADRLLLHLRARRRRCGRPRSSSRGGSTRAGRPRRSPPCRPTPSARAPAARGRRRRTAATDAARARSSR